MALIHEKLAICLADVEAIAKNSQNVQQGFRFRGIDAVYNAIHPIFSKHGIITVPEVVSVGREERQTKSGSNLLYSVVTMRHHFTAIDGSEVVTTVVGEGMDSGDKATNKAMAIAHKYALFQIFCIPTEDAIDPDSETHEVAPKLPTKSAMPTTPHRAPTPHADSPRQPVQPAESDDDGWRGVHIHFGAHGPGGEKAKHPKGTMLGQLTEKSLAWYWENFAVQESYVNKSGETVQSSQDSLRQQHILRSALDEAGAEFGWGQ